MKFSIILLLSATFVWSAYAADPAKIEEQKVLYALGQTVYRSLAVFNLTPAEFERVKQAITEAHAGIKSDVDPTVYAPKIQQLAKARRQAAGEKQAEAGKAYLEKAAKEKGAVRTVSGMIYLSLAEGKGNSPKSTDTVKVNYRGTLPDGTEFDSSFKRGNPSEFKLDNVLKCWTEGLQKMKPGGKARFVCPANLAYGDNGVGELILPGATLGFEVELIDFNADSEPNTSTPAVPEKPVKSGEK
jgi:FKBP-type peptidyl-prolyl cis-trans isomerase FkpA